MNNEPDYNSKLLELFVSHLKVRVRSAMIAMANKHQQQPIRLTCAVLLIFCANLLAAAENCESQNDDLYVIRSIGPNGLVLDATEADHVRVQHFTGSETQLWKFQRADRPGLSVIVNEHHGKALDFIKGDDGHLNLAVRALDGGSSQQQWNFDIKGHIVSFENGRHVDIDAANYTAGNRLILWKDNGCICQRWVLQKKI